ncbi:MAG: hypothetical protein HQK89_04680 [Nitrospirae bacterium]|nr:hypothetical protein [Nitrospirota bacterium]
MDIKEETSMISFPLSVFEAAETKEELEDCLLSNDPELIDELRKARQDAIKGKGVDWKALKKALCMG